MKTHRFKVFVRGVRMGMDPLVAFKTRSRPGGICYRETQFLPQEDAFEALARDWYAVGDDLAVAIQKYDDQENRIEGSVRRSS